MSRDKAKPKRKVIRGKNGGARPGAGRKKGVPNKSTGDFREYAQSYSYEAMDKLVEMMRTSENEATVLSAIEQICDRSYGRAPVAATLDINSSHTIVHKSLIEVKAALRERGIDMERLALVRPPDNDDEAKTYDIAGNG